MNTSSAPVPEFSFKQKLILCKLLIFKWTIPTYTTNDELFKLYQLAKLLPSKSIVVEIGSYIGASSLMISKGLRNDSKLFCIDTWKNDAMTEGNWDSYLEFKRNTKSEKRKIVPIRNTSLFASQDFNSTIDLLFIDGDHSYEGVKMDWDSWSPKLKSGSIVVFHDTSWANGVNRVIKEDVRPKIFKERYLPNMYWAWIK